MQVHHRICHPSDILNLLIKEKIDVEEIDQHVYDSLSTGEEHYYWGQCGTTHELLAATSDLEEILSEIEDLEEAHNVKIIDERIGKMLDAHLIKFEDIDLIEYSDEEDSNEEDSDVEMEE